MKRIVTLLIFNIIIGQLCMAQIANGSLAPNISGVDIYGNSYDLHNILGSGRGVVIDFSTAWCGPCHTMHRTHFFDLINQNYGPQGTDELVVLFLEADNSTTLADLQGTGTNTAGDFTSCTDVPILDSMESASSAYQVSGYPTFFVINPADSTTYNFDISDHSGMLPYMVEVGMINQPQVDAGMGYVCDDDMTRYICSQANTFVPQFELYNFATSTLTSLSFDILINGVYHSSQNWSGTIPSFESEELVLAPIPLSGASDVSVVINQLDGSNLDNDNLSFNVQLSSATTQNQVTVEIQTDNLGGDTYWQITNDAGNIVASGGNPWVGTTNIGLGFGSLAPQTPPGSYQSNQTYTQIVTLGSDSCYDFVITDYYGNGIQSVGGDGYTVTDHLGNVLFTGSRFGAIVTHPFLSTMVSGVNNPSADTNFQLNYNAGLDQLNLFIDVNKAGITIFDLQGRQVYQEEWNQKPIEISYLSSGMYILNVSSGTTKWSKRFVKE
jgi:thiol-disulfide isomerase/thioredoxin